jgi:sensor domain CHASE-containing protein
MVNKTDDSGQIVFLISLIVVVLILPLFLYLMASMYFDMLVLQQENKQHQAIIRRLITQLEEKNDSHSRIAAWHIGSKRPWPAI